MRTRITPSLVVSLIALVLSLTGVGYAATQLPRDSVGAAQIKAGAVGSVEVADGSLRPADFSDAAKDALEGKRGAKGAKGETGAQGPKGETGAQGPAGASGAGGDGSGLTVTGGDGVVAGTLVSRYYTDQSVLLVQSPSGYFVEYQFVYTNETPNYAYRPRDFSRLNVKYLTSDCSGPAYALAGATGSFVDYVITMRDASEPAAYAVTNEELDVPGDTALYRRVDNSSPCESDFNTVENYRGPLFRLTTVPKPLPLANPVSIG